MDIEFVSRRAARLFNDDKALRRHFGAQRARIIRRRLDQLRAAPCLADMRSLPGRTHPLRGDRAGQLAMTIEANTRLVFEPADEPLPTYADGGLDWTEVRTIRILEVVDYHG